MARRNRIVVDGGLWDCWTRADLNRNELRVLMALVRLSLGVGREDTADFASYTALEGMTGLVRHRISVGLRGLQQKGLVLLLRRGISRGSCSCYQVVCDPEDWSPGTLPTGSTTVTSQTGGDRPTARSTSYTSVTSSTGVTSSEQPPLTKDNEELPPPFGNPKGFPHSPPLRGGAVDRVWSVYRDHQPSRGKSPPKDWRSPLGARVKEFGEDAVIQVIRWAHTSSHQRAQFLRERSCLGLTLFRAANFPDYHAFSEEAKSSNGVKNEPSPFEQFSDDAWKLMSKTDREFWSVKLGGSAT